MLVTVALFEWRRKLICLLRQETQLAPTKAKLTLFKYAQEHRLLQIWVQYQATINKDVATDSIAPQPQDILINQSISLWSSICTAIPFWSHQSWPGYPSYLTSMTHEVECQWQSAFVGMLLVDRMQVGSPITIAYTCSHWVVCCHLNNTGLVAWEC